MPCRSVVSRPIFNVVMSPDCVLPVTMAHPYENYDALPYDQYREKLQPASKRSDSLLYWTKNRDHYVELLVSEIERRGIDITKGYSAWYAIGSSLAGHLGEEGRSYFHRVSRFNETYLPEDCDRQYDAVPPVFIQIYNSNVSVLL